MRIKFIEIRHMHELIQLDSGQSNSLSWKGSTRKNTQVLRLTFKSKWVGEPDNHPPCWTGQSEKAMQALGTRWSFSWNIYCVQKIQTFCIFYSGLWKYICCSFLDYHFVCRKVSLSFLTIVFGDFCQLSFLFVDFASKFGE